MTHAAVAAKISARLAVVINPIFDAKATANVDIMTSLVVGLEVKLNAIIGPTRKMIAVPMVTRFTVTDIDR